MLPDDVLLEIFHFCVDPSEDTNKGIEAWQTLVQVCRLWRTVVFGSPCRLNLRLVCTPTTPARDLLDIWPALPIAIRGGYHHSIENIDNVVAALECSSRVRQIDFTNVFESELAMEKLLAEMQVPFPELTRLILQPDEKMVLPDSFLGGSAPRLQYLQLNGISYPGLPKLLLSATHLTDLHLTFLILDTFHPRHSQH